jgi:DNA-binding MarR family transcriptional regulator
MTQAAPPATPDLAAAASDFSALLRNLWRTLVRTTRAAEHLPELPESQVDALRALTRAGSMTPGELAEELRLARPTVSNIVRDLTADGLVERRRSGADGRSAILVPTPRAREILDSFARARVDVIETILARVDPSDRRSIEQSIPALHRLLAELDAELASRTSTSSGTDGPHPPQGARP